jgi:hypothetical protein
LEPFMAEAKSRMDRFFDRIEASGFESLTLGERSAFALVWLFRETNSGSFDQFFFNDAGHLAHDALRGLDMIGAPRTAGLLRRAMSVFPNSIVPIDQAERRKFLCEQMTPEQNELLESVSQEFYRNSEPVSDLMNDYISKHPEEFPT